MDLTKEELFKLLNETINYDDIKLTDIPWVDLYMDQVTTFFDEKLKDFKRDKDDKILTKTMINNYAKAKLLTPVKGKKYSKEQMVLLSLIYNLKQVLSINDISLVLAPILEGLNLKDNSVSLEKIYNENLDINKLQADEFCSWFTNKLDFLSNKLSSSETENKETMLLILIVLMLVNSANTHKRMAEKIIDTYFNSKKEK
ncbi:DUF1836 domain-containing protein [Clostridium swellfunianum]|uniref:DUF1836 domain-containing protein n=1 Tax=Clostridium swellfunianum TaxID=1367462 RepID=UPI002030BEE1|nr:DUF1836 domain-containing protein [Clostridium swellfunianum]MCM0650712.1 DUF1836 domain-containing protein [Clostridium swellfunianum]